MKIDPCNCIEKKDVDLTNTSQQCVSTTATNYKRVSVQILCNVWINHQDNDPGVAYTD